MTNANDPQTTLQQTSPEEQRAAMLQAVQGMSAEQRAQLAQVLNQHPETNVEPEDHDAVAGALAQHAQTAQQDTESPLQSVFGSGGLFANPIAKAALVAAAGVIGSKLLRH